MNIYKITWTIEIEAETPRHAAEQARKIQLRPKSLAQTFDVKRIGRQRQLSYHINLLSGQDQ